MPSKIGFDFMDTTSQLLNTNDVISTVELKRLLQEIKDHRPDICIRLRMLGQMWYHHFFRIFLVTENGAVLIDQISNKTEIVNNLSDVIQFEIDSRFQNYQPYYHYTIQP